MYLASQVTIILIVAYFAIDGSVLIAEAAKPNLHACYLECTKDIRYVCALVGKKRSATFDNECKFQKYIGCYNTEAKILYFGKCYHDLKPKPSHPSFESELSSENIAKPSCTELCPGVYKPFCIKIPKAVITVDNGCIAYAAQCRYQKVEVLHDGRCWPEEEHGNNPFESREDDPVKEKPTLGPFIPIVPPRYAPSKCPNHWRPICGNDCVTYGNECLFRRGQLARPGLRKRYFGRCRPFCEPWYHQPGGAGGWIDGQPIIPGPRPPRHPIYDYPDIEDYSPDAEEEEEGEEEDYST